MKFEYGDKVLYTTGMNKGKVYTFIHSVPIDIYGQPACVIEAKSGWRTHASIHALVPIGSSNKDMACILEKEESL